MHKNDDINLAQIEEATQQAYAAAWTIISRIMPGTSKARASVMMLTAAAFHAGLEMPRRSWRDHSKEAGDIG